MPQGILDSAAIIRQVDVVLTSELLCHRGKTIDPSTQQAVRYAMLEIFREGRMPRTKTAQMIVLLLRAGIEGVFLTNADIVKQLGDINVSCVKKWLSSDTSWVLEQRPKHSSRTVSMGDGFVNRVDVIDDPGYRIVHGSPSSSAAPPRSRRE